MGGIKCHMGVQYGIVVLKKTIVKEEVLKVLWFLPFKMIKSRESKEHTELELFLRQTAKWAWDLLM